MSSRTSLERLSRRDILPTARSSGTGRPRRDGAPSHNERASPNVPAARRRGHGTRPRVSHATDKAASVATRHGAHEDSVQVVIEESLERSATGRVRAALDLQACYRSGVQR